MLRCQSRVALTGLLVGKIAIWGASLIAVLSVRHVSFPLLDHGLCGTWGCGPPASALIACHGFWIVLLLPAAIMLNRRVSPRTQWRLGLLLTVGGVATLAALVYWEWTHWFAAASEWQRGYLPQRILFSIATLVDAPIIETTLLGLWWLIALPGKERQFRTRPVPKPRG